MKMEKFAYIGCRTTKERKARGKGISVYKVDGDNWELVQILEGQVNPSYLCLNKAQDRLYSIHGDFCQVSAFKIRENGTLEYLNTVKNIWYQSGASYIRPRRKMALCSQSPDRKRICDPSP